MVGIASPDRSRRRGIQTTDGHGTAATAACAVDVSGRPLHSPITLETQTGMLLIKNEAILNGAKHAPRL